MCGCKSGPPKVPALAQAYAGPAVLKLRKDIPLRSPVAATVKHGEKLDIVGRRRRFLKVRAPSGAEGWTEENVLLSEEEMAALRELGKAAAKLPSQGTATTFDLLNIHTQPVRQSPSFMQVKQGDKMEVLKYLVAPRIAPVRKPLVPPPPKRPKKAKKVRESRLPPLPQPKAPGPPPNWLELSKTNLPAPPPEPPKAVPTDDWTLVRTASGQAGWVLTRRLFMAIPDEVAQYAEGHRITSYFPLGEVQDGDQKKYNWLWTTTGSGLENYDFDSFRVFIWSLRRHRYETAYVERKLRGFLPVQVHSVTLASGARTRGAPSTATFPGFSICVEKDDGRRYSRNFAFIVNVVRFAGESPCAVTPRGLPAAPAPNAPVAGVEPLKTDPVAPVSAMARLKARLTELTGRWLHKGK